MSAMRLPRQAVVEVRNPVTGPGAQWLRTSASYTLVYIGSRMWYLADFVEGQQQDQASAESCDAVAPPVTISAETLAWRFPLCAVKAKHNL